MVSVVGQVGRGLAWGCTRNALRGDICPAVIVGENDDDVGFVPSCGVQCCQHREQQGHEKGDVRFSASTS